MYTYGFKGSSSFINFSESFRQSLLQKGGFVFPELQATNNEQVNKKAIVSLTCIKIELVEQK
jgi:hypothetical protein